MFACHSSPSKLHCVLRQSTATARKRAEYADAERSSNRITDPQTGSDRNADSNCVADSVTDDVHADAAAYALAITRAFAPARLTSTNEDTNSTKDLVTARLMQWSSRSSISAGRVHAGVVDAIANAANCEKGDSHRDHWQGKHKNLKQQLGCSKAKGAERTLSVHVSIGL